MSRSRKIYNYTLEELYAILYDSSLIYTPPFVQSRVQKELKYLINQRKIAIDKFIGHKSVSMHKISKDHRSKLQYIQSLVNGWLTESVVREAILRKIYGRNSVQRVVERYSIINHPFIDKADCIIKGNANRSQLLVEIKASMNLRGMLSLEGKKNKRVFGFKVNNANLLKKEAKQTNSKIIVIWYIIKNGIFYIQTSNEFEEMTKGEVISREDWGKECYIFNTPNRKKWRSVDNLWNTK